MKEVKLIKSMYPCQDVPAVVFIKRCPSPCLYCGLYSYEFTEEKTLANGVENVIMEMSKYKGAYLSPVTDCFLPENSNLTHYLLEETWKLNMTWVPLVNTKHVISERTIKLFIKNRDRLVLQISIPTTDEEILSILEPGSASIAERFEVIKQLTNAGVPVIVVIMPWFDLGNIEDLAQKIFEAGVLRVIISNGILTNRTKNQMLNSTNTKLINIANSVQFLKEATKNGLVLSRIARIESLTRLSNKLSKFGIKSKVCISDNHDLEGSGLSLCGKFKHHNFKD